MNIKDTETIRESIDQVINAAQHLEEQADQLSSAKNSVSEYVKKASEINEQLLAVSSKVEDHIKACDNIVMSGYAEQLAAELQKNEEYLTHVREIIDGISESYKAELETISSERETYQEKINAIAEEVKESLSAESSKVAELGGNFQTLNEGVLANISDKADQINEGFESLSNKVSTSLTDKIEPLQKDLTAFKAEVSSTLSEKIDPLKDDFQSFKTEVSTNVSAKLDNTERVLLQKQNAQEEKLTSSFENSKEELVRVLEALSAELKQHEDKENAFNVIFQKQSQDNYDKTVKYESLLNSIQNAQKDDHTKLDEAVKALKSDITELKNRKTYSGLVISTFAFSLITMILSILGFIIK